MPENAVHQFLIEPAERAPETVALVNASTGLETTRQDLLTGAQQAACFLANQGVVAEQRVMMCCYDSSAFLNWFWGAIWIGAVPVPVSTMLTTKDYEFLIKDSRAVGVVFSASCRLTLSQPWQKTWPSGSTPQGLPVSPKAPCIGIKTWDFAPMLMRRAFLE